LILGDDMEKWTKGSFNALVACTNDTKMAEIIDHGKLTFTDFEDKQSLIDPYATYCKNLRNCIKDVVQAAAKEPRQRRLKNETKIWKKPDQLFEAAGKKIGENEERHSQQSDKKSDKKTNANVIELWTKLLKDKTTKQFINYLDENGHISNIGHFKKFINSEEYYSEFISTKHYDGNDGKLDHDHGTTIVNLHNKCVGYPQFREEAVRFIASMGYIWECDWIQKHDNEPQSVIDAWEWPTLEQDEENNIPSFDSSRDALVKSLDEQTDSGTWSTFVDKQNRVENLLTDIHGTRITKIWGIGGLGKTALVIACLKKLVTENKWEKHEYWRFTVKTKKQGEFTQEGISDAMNYSILQWGQSISNIITTLARRSLDYEEGLTIKQHVKLSTDYLENNPCIVVIDNAEDIEEFAKERNNDFELFEEFILNFARLSETSKSKLIITSRNRKKYHGVSTVKADYLNFPEMEALAKHRNDYLMKNRDREEHCRHLEKDNNQDDWKVIGEWATKKIGGRHEDAIGHPHFIIIAVFEWTFRKDNISFSEQLKTMVKSETISELEEYITSKSIDLLDPKLEKYCFELAAKYTLQFTQKDITEILPEDTLGLEEGIIKHLSQDLGLIKEIYRIDKIDLDYEWVEYARKELAKNYDGSRKSLDIKKKHSPGHKIDELVDQLELADDNKKINISAVIEKGNNFANSESEIMGERVISKSIMAIHQLQDAQKKRNFYFAKNQLGELEEVTNRAAIKTVKGIKNHLSSQMKKNAVILPNDCEGYVIHLSNANWKNNVDVFDEHLKFIVSNFDHFNRRKIIVILENIIMKRWALNNGKYNYIIKLGLKIKAQIRISTQNIILAAIADGEKTDNDPDLRKFISDYFSKNSEKYSMEIFRSRKSPKETHKTILQMLIEPTNPEPIEINVLEKYFSDSINLCSTFNIIMPPLKGGILHCTTEEGDIRIMLRNPPAAFKDNGTKTEQILLVQHLFSKSFSDFTAIHIKFIDINHELMNNRNLKKKEDQEKEYSFGPEDLENILSERERERRTDEDYLKEYKSILDKLLTNSFQASGPLGVLVNIECLEEFAMSSRAVRKKLGPKHKAFTKSLKEIYGKKIFIVVKGSSAIVKLNKKGFF
jgi:hypothetical protein